MTLLRVRYGLPKIETDDLSRIAAYIDAARILHDEGIHRDRPASHE